MGAGHRGFAYGAPRCPHQAAAAWCRVLDALEQARGRDAQIHAGCFGPVLEFVQVIPGSELAAIVANDMLSQALTD